MLLVMASGPNSELAPQLSPHVWQQHELGPEAMTSSIADGELQRKIEEYRARERIYLAGLLGQEAETGRLRQMAADVLSAYGDVSKAAVRGSLVYPTANT